MSDRNAALSWERDRQIVLAHLQNLMLALRSNVKFASKARLVHAPRSLEHPLTAAIQELRDRLCDPRYSHLPVPGDVILRPFAEVAASIETTEPITGVALAAFVAFLELKCEFLTVEDLQRMGRSARESRSEVMDPQSHEAIVARILQVYVACVRHPSGRYLPEADVEEMLSSAFIVATQSNSASSELLRRTAEQVMNDIVAAVYDNVVKFPPQSENGVLTSYPGVLRYVTKLIACDMAKPSPGTAIASVQLQGLCLAHTALFVLRDTVTNVECKALMQVVTNDLTRALLRVGKHSDNVIVLAQMLRTMHLVVSFASTCVVPQLLSFLTSVHMSPPLASVHDQSDLDRREREELIFESLLEFCADPAFPGFVYHHLDLSMDFHPVLENLCSFLSRASGTPAAAEMTFAAFQDVVRPITQANVLALNCLLAMVKSLEERVTRGVTRPPPSLEQRVAKKARLLKFSGLLAEEPKKAVKLLLRDGEPDVPDFFGLGEHPGPSVIASFLARHSVILDKVGLADYLSEIGKGPPRPNEKEVDAVAEWDAARQRETEQIGTIGYHMKLLAEYLTHLPFRGLPLIPGIRELVSNMGMPRESQKIDRVMEAFSKEWFKQNAGAPTTINPFKGSDAAFILSFSIMMLNTDLHSGKLDKTMPVEVFKSCNRGIDVGGASLPDEYMDAIYNEVKSRKIELIDVVDRGFDDDNAWQLEVAESIIVAERDDTKAISLRHGDPTALAAYDSPVFNVIWRSCVSAFASMLDAAAQNLNAPPLASTVEAMRSDIAVRDMSVVDGALEGLRSCALAAHHLGDREAVDHIVSLLLRFLPLQLRDGFTSVQVFGRSPKCLLVCRLVFSLVRQITSTTRAAWKDVGSTVAHMYLLGVFAEDDIGSPVASPKTTFPGKSGAAPTTPPAAGVPAVPSTPAGFVVPVFLVTNPRIAVPPVNNGSESSGWFGGIFGGSGANSAKKKERDLEDHHALLRVRSACPTLNDVLDLCTRINDSSLVEFLSGVSSVGNMRPAGNKAASPADGYVASIVVHMVVEMLILNAERIDTISGVVGQHLSAILAPIAEASEKTPSASATPNEVAAVAHWKGCLGRCCSAVERLATFLSSRAVDPHAALVLLSASTHGLPAKVTSEFAAPLCVALERLSRPTEGIAFSVEEWDQLLRLIVAVGRDATVAEIRQRCGFTLVDVAEAQLYHCPENVASLSEGLAALCIDGDVLPNDAGVWDRFNVGLDQIPLFKSPAAATPPPRSGFASRFQDVVGDALHKIHTRLAHQLRAVVSNAEGQANAAQLTAWMNSWRRLLHCLGAICFATATKNPKLGSDALLLLQRCVLDGQMSALPPAKAHDLFESVVLPLVEKVCLPHPTTSHASTQHAASVQHSSLASVLSPSMLISAVFGPLAGSGNPRASHTSAPATTSSTVFTDELQSRTASMLPKCLLQYLPVLAADTRNFMPLFQKTLALLYALHTAPRAPDSHSLLAEAVQESVRNLVLVLATTAQQPEHLLLFAPYPNFWSSTRQLVKAFDFAEPLVQQLDAMGLTSANGTESATA